MYHDDQQYTKARFLALAWKQQLQKELPNLVKKVADRFKIKPEYEYLAVGSFNCCYRVKGSHSIIRFPILCKSVFRYEKTDDEYMMMSYISRYTDIPIPKLLTAGSCDYGPYTVMSFIDGKPLSDYLQSPTEPGKTFVLKPDISTVILDQAYRIMARILLQLSQCKFTKIGAIGQDESGNWLVKKRPITMNMNQLVSCGNYPPHLLPQQPFASAKAFFVAQAEAHINHLRTQRNDAIDNEADCRKKYVARQLFLRIAKDFSTTHDEGSFPIYCDDLRPTNVLVDSELNIRGVIDWEFSYAAPAELTYCSPWWLLLTHPDDWPDGDLTSFFDEYRPRHELFTRVLRDEEDTMIQEGSISENDRLSDAMIQSLENGRFWFCLAATSSFGFDDIYWRYIDPLHFGTFTTIEDRIALLSPEERDEIEPLVRLKTRQAREEKLDEHWESHEMFTA